MKIRFMGHASFEITTKKLKLLTDPHYYSYSEGKKRQIAPVKPQDIYDYILISHEHFDHCDTQLIDEIFSEKTKIITTSEASANISHPCHTLNVGMEYEDERIRVRAIRADHPQSHNPISLYFYIPEPIYFAGDTYLYPEMGDIAPPFIAFIPIGGEYTADAHTASDIAALIRPQHIIPMHYNTWPEINADVDEFVQQIKNKTMATKVHILQPGQSVELESPPTTTVQPMVE